jgi:DNA primase
MSGFFSPATLEQVRSASDIVDVIGSYVPLKRAGANFTALCPFHKEKTPSFNVNPQKQIFHCFGCHKGGDVFSFVKEFENIPFPDAVRRLAERAKIPLETEKNPGAQQNRHLKDTLLQIHEQITQRWQNALANEACGQIARDYLAKRGVSVDAVKLFRLGYAPDLWDDTVNWAKSKGHELAVVEQGGLILKKEGGDSHYDRFRGRLMFPICDEQGRVIGFSGRILDAEQKTAKYVNSPETPIFTKGRVFFGLDKSKRALLEAECAIVCEGQLDLIACFMAGVQNMVAPQGTALTADHARILKRYVEEVVLCFDSDDAGQNAAVRSLDSLLASGLAIRVAVVPAPHDPDSFIKEHGGAAFKDLLDKAEGFFDYYLNLLCEKNDLTNDKGKMGVVVAMLEALQKTGNAALLDGYGQKTAVKLGLTGRTIALAFEKLLADQAKKSQTHHGPDNASQVLPSSEVRVRPNSQELWLLRLILENTEELAWIRASLSLDWVEHAELRQVVEVLLQIENEEFVKNPASIFEKLDPALHSLLAEVLVDKRVVPNKAQQLTELLKRLRNKFIDRELELLVEKASDKALDETQQLELLRRQEALRQLKRRPIGPSGESTAEAA